MKSQSLRGRNAKMQKCRNVSAFCAFTFLLFCFSTLFAQTKKEIKIENWLQSPVFVLNKPAFDTLKNVKGNTFEAKNFLEYTFSDFEKTRPTNNGPFAAGSHSNESWASYKKLEMSTAQDKTNMQFLFSYLNVDRFMKISLHAESKHMYAIYVDGNKILEKTNIENDSLKGAEKKKEITLEPGNHSICVKMLHTNKSVSLWDIQMWANVDSAMQNSLSFTLSSAQKMDLEHYLNGTNVSVQGISFDGKYIAVGFRSIENEEGEGVSWTEIRNAKTNAIVQTLRGVSKFQFLPKSNTYSYAINIGKKTRLLAYDLEKQSERVIMDNMDNFDNYQWGGPNDDLIIYSVSEKDEKNSSGVNKLEGMPDRWPSYRTRSSLYCYYISSQTHIRLTYGYLSTNLLDFSPDGQTILFNTEEYIYNIEHFAKNKIYTLSLKDLSTTLLLETSLDFSNASFSPDGKNLLVWGSAGLFDKDTNFVPNDFNYVAFIYNLQNRTASRLNKNFKPHIKNAWWDADGKSVYILGEDRMYVKLFKLSTTGNKVEEIPTSVDVVTNMLFSKNRTSALYNGSSRTSPTQAFLLNLQKKQSTLVANPKQDFYKDIAFGNVQPWNFTNKTGDTIEGALYFPPDFDSTKKYPVIVYYYGGVNPTLFGFDLRYPRNVWAAMGYVVYVLTPSGATGFGEKFAAEHINNWGITTADEIIDGVKKLTQEKQFINASKIGCIGASYGGFMTQLLQTRTDIFAAAISHAGISSLSSYWGEGFWGYLYSGVASANSFPWNNKKLYVEQSPLFNADKINTPLLLLHGTSDVNVPTGESYQMYTALKLLNKPVEMVEISGEDHIIANHKKRFLWEKTIVAWFDKYLKDQPQWWDEMYPKKDF